jgi:hypothetical protein
MRLLLLLLILLFHTYVNLIVIVLKSGVKPKFGTSKFSTFENKYLKGPC